MHRPRSLARLALASSLVCGITACDRGADSGGSRPNLILISIDSLRADHLGCYDYPKDTSPVLDRLAREGARFDHVIAETSWTLPTHASMLTGISSAVHQVQTDGKSLAPGFTTLAEVLRDAGYRTRGLWSGPYLHPLFGLGQGFAEADYEGVLGDLRGYDSAASPDSSQVLAAKTQNFAAAVDAVTSPTLIDKAIAFLEQPHDRPFFLFIHMFDVHFDYKPPEAIWRRFDPDYAGTFTDDQHANNPAIRADMPPGDLAHLIALYDGEIYFVDQHIGRLLDALNRQSLEDGTVVAVTADHGDEFFEHGRSGHQKTLYDEVIQVPWLVRQPGRIAPATTITAQARHVDMLPTLLGLLGVAPPQAAMGEDLAPVVRGERAARDLTAVSRLVNPRAGVWSSLRTPHTKLITRKDGQDSRTELYDLYADPRETRPLPATDPRAAGALERLAQFGRMEKGLRQALGDAGGSDVEVPAPLLEQLKELGYAR